MQQPTCTNIRIRSTHDAHVIFYAIQRKLLHMVTRRLDADERLALQTGCVYAWEERGPHTEITGLGIERFTEGRRWSPSRVRDEFLFYYEKYTPPPEVNQSSSERQPPRDWDPLVKQTYSVWVETDKGRRKWHLTAYFTQATVDHLDTIDDLGGVRDLVVPDGVFKSTRVGKNRGKADEQNTRSNDASKTSASISRTYAAFPLLYPTSSQGASPSASQPVALFEPYQKSTFSGYTPTETSSPHFTTPPPSQRSLPPVLEPFSQNSERHNQSISSSQTYPEYIRSSMPSRSLQVMYNNPQGPGSYSSTLPPANDPQYTANPVYGPSYPQQSSDDSSWLQARSQHYADNHTNISDETPSFPAERTFPPSSLSPQASSNNSFHNNAPSHERRYPSSQSQHPQSPPQQSLVQPRLHQFPPVTTTTLPPLAPVLPNPHGNLSPISKRCLTLDSLDIRRPALPSIKIPGGISPTYELSAGESVGSEGRQGEVGACRCSAATRDLIPLKSLTRGHPYCRNKLDDKFLRSFRRPS